jgi:hypothetical protein
MARQILRIKKAAEALDLTDHQVRKLIRRKVDPLPYRKIGKTLLFDMERVFKWFDAQPGRDETFD